TLRGQEDSTQGYGPANLIALLRLLRGHLSDLDLSHLFIRGAYLQGTQMYDSSLAGTMIQDSTFTKASGAICAVAASPSGRWWAASSRQGEVHVGREGDQSLHLVWQAHTDIVQTIAFSPVKHTLASGSWDGTVKLWDLDSGTLLWTKDHTNVTSIAFS